jgi:hypothetical protein
MRGWPRIHSLSAHHSCLWRGAHAGMASDTVEKSSSILLAISSLMDALVANNRGAKPRAGRDQKVATTKVCPARLRAIGGHFRHCTTIASHFSSVLSIIRLNTRTRASSMSAVPGVVARMSRRRRDWSYGVLAHSSFRGRDEDLVEDENGRTMRVRRGLRLSVTLRRMKDGGDVQSQRASPLRT